MHCCKYYCNHRHLSLLVKNRIKHISSRGLYLSSRKVAKSASLLSPYKSCSSSTSEMTLRYLLLFFQAWSSSFYTAFLRQPSFCFSLMWAMVGHFFYLLPHRHCSQFLLKLEPIWQGASRCCAGEGHCVREGGCQQRIHVWWHLSGTPLGSDWLCWFRSSGFLQTKSQPLGGATDS